MNHNITVEGGTSVKLPTAGKYCDRDIIINATGGGIVPAGVIEISKNGVHNVATYATANVNVPIPDGYVLPAGTLEINSNGSYGVANYAGVKVNVPSKEPVIKPFEITENGTYTAPEGVDGYSPITVNVPSSGGGYTDLPEGYKRVDYIQFTGEQTIDTGIICNQNTKVKADFTREKSAQHYLLGVASSDNKASVTAYLGGSFRFGNKSASKTPNTNADMIYSVILSSSEITVTGSKTTISAVNAFETVGTLQLGGCRNSSGTNGAAQFEGKITSFVMWEGAEQVLKLVPVVNSEGQYRFWDMVGKKFHDSMTDTPLTGGNW